MEWHYWRAHSPARDVCLSTLGTIQAASVVRDVDHDRERDDHQRCRFINMTVIINMVVIIIINMVKNNNNSGGPRAT